jgi:hypothetical protein
MSEEKSLESHSLIQNLMTNLRPVIEAAGKELVKLAEKTGEVRKKSVTPLPEPYFYHYEVFYYATSLLNAISRLKDIQTYLIRFPQPRTYEKHGITQDKWIEHHYANYVVTVVNLYDIALILTNVVFRLGIPPRQCRDNVVKENEWVKKTQVKPALDHLNRHI